MPLVLSCIVIAVVYPAVAIVLKPAGDAPRQELVSAGRRRKSRNQPHIVFVLADDLGWNGVGYTTGPPHEPLSYAGLGYTGSNTSLLKKVRTPFIDKLAAEGVILNAYYAAAYCAPSRFALLTGRAPWRSEAGYDNFRADTPIGTDPAYEMLPAALKKVGYKTHLVGKWHQGFHRDVYLPTNRGFDTAYGIMDSCGKHFTHEIYHNEVLQCMSGGHAVVDLSQDGAPAFHYDADTLSDDLYRKRAVELIQSHDQTKPLFLYLALQLAHEPFEITKEYSSKYSLSEEENVYWGMHAHVDDTVKSVVEALEDAKMYSNTVLVFASDNGAPIDKVDTPFHANFPMRGHKGQLLEGGIHVPCFVHGGALPDSAKGRQLEGLMSVSDWYSTFAHVSGAELYTGGPAPHDSIDNWKYIIGESTESSRDEIMHHYMLSDGVRQSVLRWGQFKAINFHVSCSLQNEKDPCPINYRQCTPAMPCVYDLENDPAESLDIAYDNLELMKQMADRMDSFWKEAYAQPFFGVARPSPNMEDMHKACTRWQKQGGFLTPWATAADEDKFTLRELSVKISEGELFEVDKFMPVG